MRRPALPGRGAVIVLWLMALAVCVIVIARTSFTADLSAFLPAAPSKEQRILLDQLQSGVVSRLILIGIEGGDAPARAALSKETARRLRNDPAFVLVSNGEQVHHEKDQAFLFNNRYLLSPAVNAERFSAAGLHTAIGDTIDLIASPAGMLVKSLLPRDPTGEMLQLFEQMNGGKRPRLLDGVWASHDGARAVLLVQTRAAGFDTDGQQQAMQKVQTAFDAALAQHGMPAGAARLVMTGPGVFSVTSRATIEREVTRLSILSTLLIVTLLLLVYRSLTALLLGLLPVLSGALVGVVAVSLGFGVVHGITLGFGTTLIGEAVDYSIYLFVQSRRADAANANQWVADFWPTIRLGVLTSITGFASLLLSGFPGLAQLGLYSIAGLVAAAMVTRFVLPRLLPADFRIRDVTALGALLQRLLQRAACLRLPLLAVALAACAVVFWQRDTLWNTELSSLSPVPLADQQADTRLRADMGAPDVRYMVVVSAPSREAALAAAEQVARRLDPLVAQGMLASYESPARYLPSSATQRARQASLPGPELAQRLTQAVDGLPVRAAVFAPFLADVAAARSRAPLTRVDLDGTSLALAVDSLLFERQGRWTAMLPLTAPTGTSNAPHGIAIEQVRAALVAAGQPEAMFVDLKAESDNLYSGYLHEAILLSLGGLAGIVLLLLWSLRSPMKVLRVLLPLVAAVAIVVALLALCGQRLTILHLVGLLLIVAVGSNYALFFSGGKNNQVAAQTLVSLLFANLTTVAGFGLLGFSQVPVLEAIGVTVGPGAVLALLLSAVFAGGEERAGPAAAVE